MAAPPLPRPLQRFNVPPPLNMHQSFDARQPIFSPALQQSYPPPFQLPHTSLQTPMQPFFPPQPPNAPGRPTYQHHKGHSSIAHFAFPPPTAIPITPLGQGFPIVAPPFGQPFIPRNRRAPSVSIGGPPKAPLGGPGRKHSPLPPPPVVPVQKGKKVVINLPVETMAPAAEDLPPSRPPWARTPMPVTSREEPVVVSPEIMTAETYPPDAWRHIIPETVDVFLPGKVAWDEMRQRLIDEKLERLGVERGTGGSVSVHAPHARAASISSPADPSLLYFKLNKLQQSQNASATNSLSSSPQQLFDLAPSPGSQVPPRLQNRHGHSLSLAPIHQQNFNPASAFNPFGPGAILGSDTIEHNVEARIPSPIGAIHAPQGRVPLSIPPIGPSISRGNSRPDFIRGFGLEIPEEEEPQEEAPHRTELESQSPDNEDGLGLARLPSQPSSDHEGMTPVAQSTLHSRHVSKLSHALSLRSVGGIHDMSMSDQVDMVPIRSPTGNPTVDDLDQEAVGEWTGSEDIRLGSDDEESIGEWSNPSDEERARQERMRRRLLRHRNHEIETPRRLPNFPTPPNNLFGLRVRREYDLVSNPSEDGIHAEQRAAFLGLDPIDFTLGPSSTSTPGRRPLPPLPHSRDPSAQFGNEPAEIHSRSGSDTAFVEQHAVSHAVSLAPPPALNPLAKPFVFGSSKRSSPWGSFDGVALPPAPGMSHTRLPSFGKPLNAAAQEFKPAGFTFRPPLGGPQLAFPVSPASHPLPAPPIDVSPVRAQQGREKRQRRGSHTTVSDDGDDDSGKENMASFRFPPVNATPHSIRHSAPNSPHVTESHESHTSGGPLQPLTFSGSPSDSMRLGEELEEMELEEDYPENGEEHLSAAPVTKPKRAPIPLDFTNPPANTVPAGVFKALVGDEKTRRTVRSRLGSRDIFEHSQRPSLDDFAVPAISMSANKSRSRFVTDPGLKPEGMESPDIFTPAIKRRSSLPAMHSAHNSTLSNVSIPAVNLTKRLEAQALEDKLEAILDDKLQMIRSEIANTRGTPAAGISPATEDAIAEVVALFRTQLQESAVRGLDDSQMDARGELDLELIRDAIQRGHDENLLVLQTELREALSRIEQVQPLPVQSSNMEIIPILDQVNHRNLQVILTTLGQLSNKIDTRPFADQYEKDSFIEEILTALGPHLKTLRPEAVDYDTLTARLSQAVKPNIEQLIDLAADKRETAGLIVESLIPLLPPSSSFDMPTIIGQISSEVRRVIAPIDAHEIKEQVADLVVERLDARLSNRDKAFNIDSISDKVAEGVLGGLRSIQDVVPKLDILTESQESLSAQNNDLLSKHVDVVRLISSLPSQFENLKQTVEGTVANLSLASPPTVPEASEAIQSVLRELQTSVEAVANGQNSMLVQRDEDVVLLKSYHQDLSNRLSSLPESLTVAVTALQNAHAEFVLSRDAARCDAEEIRTLKSANNDLQVQLAKARGAHGQVRVEKDNLSDRLKDAENDRDMLRARVDELQAAMNARTLEVSAVELRNSELEDALSQSLARLKTSDVAAQLNQERITELEKINKDATAERQALKARLEELQIQVKTTEKEKELIAQSLQLVQQEYESMLAQQSHWDDLRRVTEQIETLTSLRSQVDEDELRELRHVRDQHRQLESEYSALQKRVRDHEFRAANSERTANTAKQSLIQAQQRASEWERRAREYENDLEATRNKLDEVEQVHVQLDADYSLARLQLEEKEAEDRLVKDRENKLRDQVSNLEAQVARLEAELSRAKLPSATHLPLYGKPAPIKDASPPRPDSRASTVFDGDRSRTPVGRVNGMQAARTNTPPQTSVWDSMHAPKQRYPQLGSTAPSYVRKAAPTPSYRPQSVASTYRAQSVASPTPSTASLAPTMGEDGWWS